MEARYEARVGSDGHIQELTERIEGRPVRPICPTSPEAIALLSRGADVVYRFDEGGSLRGLPYLEVLEAMRRDILLTAHKARHEMLADEPEALPALRQLLVGIEANVAAFQRAFEKAETDISSRQAPE